MTARTEETVALARLWWLQRN